jgi:hypothetical protein
MSALAYAAIVVVCVLLAVVVGFVLLVVRAALEPLRPTEHDIDSLARPPRERDEHEPDEDHRPRGIG